MPNPMLNNIEAFSVFDLWILSMEKPIISIKVKLESISINLKNNDKKDSFVIDKQRLFKI